jgi:hypothetical protein
MTRFVISFQDLQVNLPQLPTSMPQLFRGSSTGTIGSLKIARLASDYGSSECIRFAVLTTHTCARKTDKMLLD